MGKSYRIALKEGRSHSGPGGIRWVYGQQRILSEGDPNLDHYLRSPRFTYQEIEGAAPPPGATPPPAKPQRTRAEVREARRVAADPAQREPDPEPDPEETKPEDPPPAKYSEKVVKLARARIDEKKVKRETLEAAAIEMGATGPNGEAPADAPSKGDLVKWITKRQGEILADIAG